MRYSDILLNLFMHSLMHRHCALQYPGRQITLGEVRLLGAAALMLRPLCVTWRLFGKGAAQLGKGMSDKQWHSKVERIRISRAPGCRSTLANLAQQPASSPWGALSLHWGKCCAVLKINMQAHWRSLGKRRH